MPIRINRNNYVPNAIQLPLQQVNPNISNIGKSLEQLGLILAQSSEARDNADASNLLAEYNCQTSIALKKIELSGSQNIAEDFNKESAKIKENLLRDKNNYVTNLFNKKVKEIDTNNTYKANMTQLDIDETIQHNKTEEAIANNLLSIKANSSNYETAVTSSLDLINSKNSMLNAAEKVAKTKEIYLKSATNKALSDYNEGLAVNTILRRLSNNSEDGNYSINYKGKEYNLNKGEQFVIAQNLVNNDFARRLASDPVSLLNDINNGNFPFEHEKLGTLVDKKDQEIYKQKAITAVKELQNKESDQAKMIINNTISNAWANPTVENIEAVRLLAENENFSNNKKLKENYELLKLRNPVNGITDEETITGLANLVKELSEINTNREATKDKESGENEFIQKQLEIYNYIQDRNQRTKTLSKADRFAWDTAVTNFMNVSKENLGILSDNIKLIDNVRNIKTSFKKHSPYTQKNLKEGNEKFMDKMETEYVHGMLDYINNMLTVVSNKDLSDEQRKVMLSNISNNYLLVNKRMYMPWLFDGEGNEVKVGAEVIVNGFRCKFNGYKDKDRTQPSLIVIR